MSKSDFKKEIYIIITNEKNKKKACKLGNLLLKKKLISCVSFKNIESHFWWEGKINRSREVQLMIKCKKENVYKVCNKISDWHSYQVPEIIYFGVSSNEKYHYWINSI